MVSLSNHERRRSPFDRLRVSGICLPPHILRRLRGGLKTLAYILDSGLIIIQSTEILDSIWRQRLPSNVGKEVMRMDDNRSDGFRAVQPHRHPLEVMAG